MLDRYKMLVLGIIVGIICSISAQVVAAPIGAMITAYLTNDIGIVFDDVEKKLPEGYNVLTYNGRTYVPARFIAEELGAEVEWIESSRKIKITSPVKEQIVKTPATKDVEKTSEVIDSRKYEKLPIVRNYSYMTITTTAVVRDTQESRIYFILENKESTPIQMLHRESYIEVDGKKYYSKDMPAFKFDDRWYNDVIKDDKVEGYVVFPVIDKDVKNIHAVVKVISNETQKVETIEFNIFL